MNELNRRSKVPYALIALCLVPMLGGALRLAKLGSDQPHPADARFLHDPQPILLHIVCVAVYSLLGAFQFDDDLRRRAPTRHRYAGWIAVTSGLGAAVSGVWMTVNYSIPPAMMGPLLYWVRLLVGGAMAMCLVLALVQIGRRNVTSHQAFMIRAYALGQGAGTQVILLGLPAAVIGHEILGPTRDLLMTASWLVNVVIAEAVVRRRSAGLTPNTQRHPSRLHPA